MNIRRCSLLAAALSFAFAVTAPAARGLQPDAVNAFERLKTLEGTWAAPAPGGKQATSTFELVAGGTVLIERYSNPAMPAGGHMVSAYHLDGTSLVLTHYCIAKNQPTLRADRYDAVTAMIQFEFLRGASMPDENVGHMRRAMYRVEGRDRFTTEWEYFQNGRKTFTETETFTRVR